MKGSHRIVIESARLKYEFVIRRNLTIIQGDSATGKTTLMDLLSDYRRGNAPIRLESDVPCEVFSGGGERWRAMLELIRDSIVFIDEGNRFIHQFPEKIYHEFYPIYDGISVETANGKTEGK